MRLHPGSCHLSSGTGRTVSFREDDYELAVPSLRQRSGHGRAGSVSPSSSSHLSGTAASSDVLNKDTKSQRLTQEMMAQLAAVENELCRDLPEARSAPELQRAELPGSRQVRPGDHLHPPHFWFHALIIIIHQPFTSSGLKRPRLLPTAGSSPCRARRPSPTS